MITALWTPPIIRRLGAGVTAFAVLALLGPVIRALVPYSASGDFGHFIYFLVLSLWPAQPLAIMEVSIGTPAAIVLALTVNIALFAIVGTVAGLASTKLLVLRLVEATVLLAVIALALLWGGMNVEAVHMPALAVALLCYAATFEWLARRSRRGVAA